MSPGWTQETLVEPMGFEPTTSSMPSRRAPNCATAPLIQLQNFSTSLPFLPSLCPSYPTPVPASTIIIATSESPLSSSHQHGICNCSALPSKTPAWSPSKPRFLPPNPLQTSLPPASVPNPILENLAEFLWKSTPGPTRYGP